MTLPPKDEWVLTDFNGMLEPDLVCLSHDDVVEDQGGRAIQLRAGLQLTAFDLDADGAGRPDNIIASGTVEPSPSYAECQGSRWALRIDARGVRNRSEVSSVELSTRDRVV